MENIIKMLAGSFGIPPQVANLAINAATKMVLQKSSPKTAESLLSSMPKQLVEKFNDDDRKQLVTTQIDLNRYDLIKQLSEITNIKDIDKLDQLADSVLDDIRQNSQINTSDGLDKDELFTALQSLYRKRSL
ncbi:MAG: hypothetical protein DA328_03915 [Nitrososphaeraceae archaeon]|nr:hypothetical protein [Nitrososphaeraceae archaeon]